MLISEHETKFPRDASRREVSNLWLYFTHVPGVTRRLPTVSPPLFPRFFAPISPSNEAIVETNFALCPFLLPLFLSILLDRARPLSPFTFVLRARNDRKERFRGGGEKIRFQTN